LRLFIGLLLAFSISISHAAGLEIKDIKSGNGKQAKLGDTVSVHYTGWLM